MTDNEEPTRDELEQRVDQLESTVQKMLPDRRQTLTGLGLLAGGGLLGGSASGSTGAAGDVGTPNDRPTIYPDEVRDQNDDQLVNYDASGVNFQVPVSTDGLTLNDKVIDRTDTISAGETFTRRLNTSNGGDVTPNFGDAFEIVAVPAADPGSDIGFTVDKIFYNSTDDNFIAQISETEGTGGDVRIVGWRID